MIKHIRSIAIHVNYYTVSLVNDVYIQTSVLIDFTFINGKKADDQYTITVWYNSKDQKASNHQHYLLYIAVHKG